MMQIAIVYGNKLASIPSEWTNFEKALRSTVNGYDNMNMIRKASTCTKLINLCEHKSRGLVY